MKDSYCLAIDEKLPYYMEEELSSTSREDIKRHISRCVECQRRYENLKSTVSALRSIDKDIIRAPLEFAENVTGKVMELIYENCSEKKKTALYRLSRKNVIVGATIVAALVFLGIEISHTIHKKQLKAKLS
ncbi:MAG: zf-HC2 domain-containing protein [Actinobacteria bacterium]|nr:zf-HC2 domain-containing protein [Actinomycetota bacterium]